LEELGGGDGGVGWQRMSWAGVGRGGDGTCDGAGVGRIWAVTEPSWRATTKQEFGWRATAGAERGRGTCDGPAGQTATERRRWDLRWSRAGGRREVATAVTGLAQAEQ